MQYEESFIYSFEERSCTETQDMCAALPSLLHQSIKNVLMSYEDFHSDIGI